MNKNKDVKSLRASSTEDEVYVIYDYTQLRAWKISMLVEYSWKFQSGHHPSHINIQYNWCRAKMKINFGALMHEAIIKLLRRYSSQVLHC